MPLTPRRARNVHGGTYFPEYRVWWGMICRCTYPSSVNYADYGGRGIRVCERWQSFQNFYEDLGPRPGNGREWQLDREDNDGPYDPKNCRWLRKSQNVLNTRRVNRKGDLRGAKAIAVSEGISLRTHVFRRKHEKGQIAHATYTAR